MKRQYSAPKVEKVEFHYGEQVVASGPEICEGVTSYLKSLDSFMNGCTRCEGTTTNNF